MPKQATYELCHDVYPRARALWLHLALSRCPAQWQRLPAPEDTAPEVWRSCWWIQQATTIIYSSPWRHNIRRHNKWKEASCQQKKEVLCYHTLSNFCILHRKTTVQFHKLCLYITNHRNSVNVVHDGIASLAPAFVYGCWEVNWSYFYLDLQRLLDAGK